MSDERRMEGGVRYSSSRSSAKKVMSTPYSVEMENKRQAPVDVVTTVQLRYTCGLR